MNDSASPPRPRNPYVGPRAFRAREKLPNRERTARELTDLLIAERAVLLHAPSGAGKTSLIQAAVSDLLVDEGFDPTRPTRVDRAIPDGISPANRYVFSVALDLLEPEVRVSGELTSLKLAEVVAKMPGTKRRVLVLDQFEEILTLDPTDREQREMFFRQLGELLRGGDLWLLVAMREDFMGGLEGLLRHLPGQLRSRFRLDFLQHDEAILAMQRPAESQGVTFDEDAADHLVNLLAEKRVDRPGEKIVTRRSQVVEPFQLQVVCRQLWKDVRQLRGDDFERICLHDVKTVDIGGALGRYYALTMSEFGKNERVVRDWFEDELINVHGDRTQTSHLPLPDEAGQKAVSRLIDAYLLRSDTRASTTWYELTHDRLVPAVLDQNDSWRTTKLPAWQAAAYRWRRKDRRNEYLLPASELRTAPQPSARHLTEHEREFLRRSFDEARSRQRSRRLALVPVLAVVATVELLVIVLLLVTL